MFCNTAGATGAPSEFHKLDMPHMAESLEIIG